MLNYNDCKKFTREEFIKEAAFDYAYNYVPEKLIEAACCGIVKALGDLDEDPRNDYCRKMYNELLRVLKQRYDGLDYSERCQNEFYKDSYSEMMINDIRVNYLRDYLCWVLSERPMFKGEEETIAKAEQEKKAKEAAQKAEQERRAREAAQKAEQERRAREVAQKAEQERRVREVAQKAEQERRAREAEKSNNSCAMTLAEEKAILLKIRKSLESRKKLTKEEEELFEEFEKMLNKNSNISKIGYITPIYAAINPPYDPNRRRKTK